MQIGGQFVDPDVTFAFQMKCDDMHRTRAIAGGTP